MFFLKKDMSYININIEKIFKYIIILYNNVTFGLENSRNGSHIRTII